MKTVISALAFSLTLGVTTADAKPWGGHGDDHRGNGPQGGWQQMGPQGGLKMFSEFDTNGDGYITRVELDAHAQTRFDAADTNGDGFLDPDELTAQGAAMREKMEQFGHGPWNNDDRAEQFEECAQEMLDRMIDRFDIDDDGKMSLAEMQAAHPGLTFDLFDATGDGKISEAEWHEATQHRDRNGPRQDRR